MKTINTYSKYCPNVFVAKCTEQHQKGDLITLTTKYGQEHENEVHNYLGKTKDGFFLYSITRIDGFNSQKRAERKAERLNGYAANAEKRSNQYYEASKEGRDFLVLAEPIKVGHHSEKRHRALIERNFNRMGKSVAEYDKSKEYQRRAEYWESKTDVINLSMPESLDYFEFKLENAKKTHQFLKDNPDKRPHSMALSYANIEVKEIEKNLVLAVKLWGDDDEIELMKKEQEAKPKRMTNAERNAKAEARLNAAIEKYGGFFHFGNGSDVFKAKYNELVKNGYLEDGDKVTHVVHGLYTPSKTHKEFIKEL